MNEIKEIDIIGIAALLIHAAKIDEIYTEKEKNIIINLIKLLSNGKIVGTDLLIKAEKLEKNSNQLLNFTNVIKKYSDETKSIIVKNLWKIIISDKKVDQYESNLMRRICGLIYFSDKLSGEIKLKILKEVI
tara:strand:+ start:960 stop:1355 length:396 start_codon:yes stop_codon:yes gene_type:complete